MGYTSGWRHDALYTTSDDGDCQLVALAESSSHRLPQLLLRVGTSGGCMNASTESNLLLTAKGNISLLGNMRR